MSHIFIPFDVFFSKDVFFVLHLLLRIGRIRAECDRTGTPVKPNFSSVTQRENAGNRTAVHTRGIDR